ncbi:MAG: hypothetical protein IPO21_08220 [Bacteroidales bacterium]|nr:hypothetical protein [Bacteroidales bacterium]
MIGVSANYATGISSFEIDSFFSPVRASAFTIGVPFRANFKPWFFSSTLNVTFLNTEADLSYSYNRAYNETVTLYDTLDVYKIIVGKDTLRRYTIQEKDSSILVYKTEGDTLTEKNRYTFLSLPLMTGLQFDAKHFSFAISAGVVVSCLVTNNKNNKVADENSFIRESQLLLRRFYLEPTVDIEFFIPFSENFDLSLGLVYRYSNKSIYKQQNYIPLNQSFAPKVSFFLHF